MRWPFPYPNGRHPRVQRHPKPDLSYGLGQVLTDEQAARVRRGEAAFGEFPRRGQRSDG